MYWFHLFCKFAVTEESHCCHGHQGLTFGLVTKVLSYHDILILLHPNEEQILKAKLLLPLKLQDIVLLSHDALLHAKYSPNYRRRCSREVCALQDQISICHE